MTGRLVAVVGPSGVGKDSVIAGMIARDPGLAWVRRVITRPPSDSEPFESVTREEFARRKRANAFVLDWRAHGLDYAIPGTTVEEVERGATRIANLSRSRLVAAADAFPRLTVLNITAPPEVLADRLAARGRETAEEIAARLAHRAPLPEGLDIIEIDNGGTLDQAVTDALDALSPVRS
ncbi:phosphonate metabolism protein/1,5-bisphosphokinase (PRPP-forming) PhnN [Roseobacter sp. HKCCA0434]|uniref:phosphonate metabolism protein/1,5-bisphosphokinase (PRPP-forming) PhnN n=1 Tax=Roseobacter sp. HKCCA0434 TaxID=3079297 RepID=UPI002905A3D3|nr:phosphonate metabolism protein/1,5-bisphosphokinase (PRPP-forming) PhnN [Roseobacter sp. HKCCA0434]